jgi:peroxiredoxin
MLRPGTKAPVFELTMHTDETFKLSDLLGKNHLVLFFYPRDFTHGCTREGIIRGASHHEINFKKHWRNTLDLLKSLNGDFA